MKRCILMSGLLLTAVLVSMAAHGGEKSMPRASRLIFQDQKSAALLWADVGAAKDKPVLSAAKSVDGWPKVDAAKQKLVQMQASLGYVVVGIRDNEKGTLASGWALLHAGVDEEEHGDHSHWNYEAAPAVWDHRLDAKQGNPAHVYRYDKNFYLANDQTNGFTRIDPRSYRLDKKGTRVLGTPGFHLGGGSHITLAVAQDRVAYSCWVDSKGVNAGKVDVIAIKPAGNTEIAYSFFTPTGGLHGAAYAHGKVFFAPAKGICWVDADTNLQRKGDKVTVKHLSLGHTEEKPNRTGAFATTGKHIACVTGRGKASKLVFVDAQAKEPNVHFLPLPIAEAGRASTPVFFSKRKKTYALLIEEQPKDAKEHDNLLIVDCDPNGDGSFHDSTIVKTITIGRNAIEGHAGHHGLAVDGDQRWLFVTNPGDGTIQAIALTDWSVRATWTVGGTPTAILAIGGAEDSD